jgi:hypothetical protein
MTLQSTGKRWLWIVVFATVLLGTAQLTMAGKVSATPSAYSPNPANVTPSTDRVAHIVSKATYNQVDSTDLIIYSPTNSIGVAIVSADICDNNQKLEGIEDVRNTGMNSVPTNTGPGGTVGRLSSFSLKTMGGGQLDVGYGYKRSYSQCDVDKGMTQELSPGMFPLGEPVAQSTVVLHAYSGGIPLTYKDTSGNSVTLYKFKLNAAWIGAGQCSPGLSCGVNAFVVQALPIVGSTYGDGSSMWISQDSTEGAKNFGLSGIGNYANASDPNEHVFYDYKTEFGSDCTLEDGEVNPNAKMEIYDDDNYNEGGAQDPNTPFEIRLLTAKKGSSSWTDVAFTNISTNPNGGLARNYRNGNWYVLGTNSHVASAPWTIDLKFPAVGGYQYRFMIRNIDGHNNLQFSYPYDTIWADKVCTDSSVDTVYVQPDVQAGVSSGASASFSVSASVINFPSGMKQWGYSEVASQNAKSDNVFAQQVDYPAQRDGVSPDGVAKRKCQSGWAASCGTYECANGSLNSTCGAGRGYYQWRCEYPGLANKVGPSGQSAPNCNVVLLRCKDSSGNLKTGDLFWATDANALDINNYCHNKWVCPAKNPSNGAIYNTRDDFLVWQSATSDPNYECRYFSCWNANDPQNFYTANGNQPKDRCDNRCQKGKGPHAPRATNDDNRWGTGDQHCYIQPGFNMHCTWTEGSALSTSPDQPVNGTTWPSAFCTGPGISNYIIVSTYSPRPGEVCAKATAGGTPSANGPFTWLNDGVNYLPPGLGNYSSGSGDFTSYRTTWNFAVLDSPEKCVQVGAKPYYSVLGGDVAAGPGFGSACTPTAGASIIGANQDAAPYNGATAQLAALALGNIKSFATGKTPSGATWVDSILGGTSPSELAFANTNTAPSLYGGNYSKTVWCVPDYYGGTNDAGANTVGAIVSADSLLDGVNKHDGDLILTGGTIAAGKHVTLKVINGNVYITGNVTYGDAGSIGDLPQFRLLVNGNINVDNAVSRLDGFYDAQGTSLAGGIFASCGLPTGPVYLDISGCSNQLVINGGVAAGLLVLNRTPGDRNGEFGQSIVPAETIIFSPQFWAPTPSRDRNLPWQSLTSLPPIL